MKRRLSLATALLALATRSVAAEPATAPTVTAAGDGAASDDAEAEGGDDASTYVEVRQMELSSRNIAARNAFYSGRRQLYRMYLAEAREAFAKATELDPNFAIAYAHGALTVRNGMADKALADKAVSLAGQATEGERLLIEAVAAQVRGDRAVEEDRRRRVLAIYPRDWRLLLGLGNRLAAWGRSQEAVPLLEQATRVASDEAAPWNDLGYAYLEVGRMDDALRAMRRYVEALPDDANPHDSLAYVLLQAGKLDEAVAEYRKAVAADPAFVIGNLGLGDALVLAGDLEEAREAYRRLAEQGALLDDRMRGYDLAAATWLHEGRPEEAERAWSRARLQAELAKAAGWEATFAGRRALALMEAGKDADAKLEAAAAERLVAKAGGSPAEQAELHAYGMAVSGIVAARTGDLATARKQADAMATAQKSHAPTQRIALLTQALRATVAARLPADAARSYAVKAEALADDPWGAALLADWHERLGESPRAAELRASAQRMLRVTPELGLVRPRLLSGQTGADVRFGPMPVTTRSAAALALFNEARRLGESYRNAVALATLEKAVALDPDFALAHCFLGLFSESAQDADPHLRQAARLLESGKASAAERLFVEAHLAGADGDLASLERKLGELSRQHPQDWRPPAYQAVSVLRAGRTSTAIQLLEEARKRGPQAAFPLNALGHALAREGRIDAAVEVLTRYVELSPGEPNPHDSLAEVLLQAGRYADAEQSYERSLELQPQFGPSLAGLGHARLLRGDTEGARDAYGRMAQAAALPHERLRAAQFMARTLSWRGEHAAAAAWLERSAAEARTVGDTLGAVQLDSRRVMELAEAGRGAEAVALANSLAQGLPKKLSAGAKAAAERQLLFARGWAQLKAGKLPEARATAAALEAATTKAGAPELRGSAAALQGAVLLAGNEAADAVAVLNSAPRQHPLVAALLVQALEQSGRKEEAEQVRASHPERRAVHHDDLALAWRRLSPAAAPRKE